MPVTYKEETYKQVLRWTADTKIRYVPNPKRGKSAVRYASYAKAKTVGQAMIFKSKPQDLFFDYEHGYIKVLGGAIRQKPLNPDEETKDWTAVDKMLAKMHRGWKTWTKTFAVAKKLGVDRRQLTAGKVTSETNEVRAARLAANELAKIILKDVAEKKRKLLESDVVAVLSMWGFKENENRRGVIPKGKKFVFSDTLGLVSNYRGCVSVAQATTEYSAFTKVITGWLRDHMPTEFKKNPFCFTSINVNANYAAALHRDANNEGPSLIKAFGAFSGGKLNYWKGDDKSKGTVRTVCKPGKCEKVDLKKYLLMFDGNRGHCVDDFKGNRFSLVYFSIGQYHKANTAVRQELAKVGIRCPSKQEMSALQKKMGENGMESWAAEDVAKAIDFTTPSYVKRAKDAALIDSEKNEASDCKDTKFVGHEIKYVTLPDGRRGVRVFLKGTSGGQRLVVSGDEDKKGSSHYHYKKVDNFKQGPPLDTIRIGDVRTWIAGILKVEKLNGPIKRCVSSFSSSDSHAKKRRLSAAGA